MTAIRKSILPSLWDQSKERSKGTSASAIDLNRFIEEARIRIHQIVTELQQEGAEINPLIVQQRFYGVGQVRKQERTILQVLQEHNDEAKQLIGKDFVEITWRRYETMKRYLGELIKQKYDVDDLPLSDFTGEVIRAYEVYLKTEKDLCQNTLIRYMKALKKITNRCLANDWIRKDPFAGIKFREDPTDPEFLTLEEVDRIYNCNPGSKRLEVIRDMFLMSTFTGLAFTDVSQLTENHIVTDNNGNKWIRKPRQKTKQMSNIPLLDIPLAIIEKYHGNKKAAKKGVLLPIPCNQMINRYLKIDSHHLQDQQTPDNAHSTPHLRNPLPLARRKPKKRLKDPRSRQRQDDRTLRPRPRLLHPPRHERHPRHPQPRQSCSSRRFGVEL